MIHAPHNWSVYQPDANELYVIDADGVTIARFMVGRTDKTGHDNARLCAKAPELLQAATDALVALKMLLDTADVRSETAEKIHQRLRTILEDIYSPTQPQAGTTKGAS